jgi:hypothetical protein
LLSDFNNLVVEPTNNEFDDKNENEFGSDD